MNTRWIYFNIDNLARNISDCAMRGITFEPNEGLVEELLDASDEGHIICVWGLMNPHDIEFILGELDIIDCVDHVLRKPDAKY